MSERTTVTFEIERTGIHAAEWDHIYHLLEMAAYIPLLGSIKELNMNCFTTSDQHAMNQLKSISHVIYPQLEGELHPTTSEFAFLRVLSHSEYMKETSGFYTTTEAGILFLHNPLDTIIIQDVPVLITESVEPRPAIRRGAAIQGSRAHMADVQPRGMTRIQTRQIAFNDLSLEDVLTEMQEEIRTMRERIDRL